MRRSILARLAFAFSTAGRARRGDLEWRSYLLGPEDAAQQAVREVRHRKGVARLRRRARPVGADAASAQPDQPSRLAHDELALVRID